MTDPKLTAENERLREVHDDVRRENTGYRARATKAERALDDAEARLAAAKQLHQRQVVLIGSTPVMEACSAGCRTEEGDRARWPCATARVLDGTGQQDTRCCDYRDHRPGPCACPEHEHSATHPFGGQQGTIAPGDHYCWGDHTQPCAR